MTITDGFIVLGVLGSLTWMIVHSASEKKPSLRKWLHDLNPPKDPIRKIKTESEIIPSTLKSETSLM